MGVCLLFAKLFRQILVIVVKVDSNSPIKFPCVHPL